MSEFRADIVRRRGVLLRYKVTGYMRSDWALKVFAPDQAPWDQRDFWYATTRRHAERSARRWLRAQYRREADERRWRDESAVLS